MLWGLGSEASHILQGAVPALHQEGGPTIVCRDCCCRSPSQKQFPRVSLVASNGCFMRDNVHYDMYDACNHYLHTTNTAVEVGGAGSAFLTQGPMYGNSAKQSVAVERGAERDARAGALRLKSRQGTAVSQSRGHQGMPVPCFPWQSAHWRV